jgi:hypothetical protein
MIDLGSIAGLHERHHELAAYCERCDRWAVLPLADMIVHGQGARRLPLPVRCRWCGAAGRLQVRPPVLYRVDPATGRTDRIVVDTPLVGFIDGIILHQGKLYVLTPDGDGSGQDWVQVVALDKEMLNGTLLGIITDPDMDGVASGAIFGDSLYVNNARYYDFPAPENEYWITKLDIKDVQPR